VALDSKLTQNINLRANGEELLRPLTAMGNQLNRLIKKMEQVANPSTAKGRQELEKLTMQAQRALSTIRTIDDVINGGSRSGRAKNNLLGGLSEQALGRQVLSASKLRTELEKTTSASQALEVRLSQLYKKFNDLGNAGRAIGQRDIAKALGTQEAIRQVQALEREISRLDARNAARGGLTPEQQAIRSQLGTSYDTLLTRVQGGRRVDFSKEIAQVSLLSDSYKKVTRDIEATATVAQRAAAQRRAAIMDTINMNEAQLRASVNRGASQFAFSPDQARQFNIPALNAQIEQGTQRLQQYQLAMSRAVEQGRSAPLLDRLALGFNNVKNSVSEAEAKIKAFNALPEQRMKAVTSMLFSGGGLAFGARILGASLITTGIFGVINAAQQGAQYIAQLEDAFAKLQAISGSTDTEMQKFAGSLLKLSENSRYSTLEIAQGATQIAQAGYGAADSVGVLDASLKLAAGSGSTVTEAVETMTSSLGAFNLQASEAGHVADVLMEGLNRSKLSITQMQAALQYTGATAHETGISIEELTAIAASLANAGIRSGSTIGTGIRMLLVDLQTPTEKFKQELKSLGLTMADVDVKSKGLAEVVRKLTDAGFSAEAAYNGFEVRAAAAFLAFRNQIDLYDELSVQLTKTGAAAAASAKASDSLAAKWQMTKNKLSELVTLMVGPFMNVLKGLLTLVGGVIDVFASFANSIAESIGGVGNLSILLTALLPIVGALFGPTGALIGGVLALMSLAGALGGATDKMDKLTAATNEAEQKMQASRQTVTSVDEAIQRLIERQDQLRNNHVALQVETLNLTEKFQGLSSILGGAAKSYDDLVEAMLRYRGVAMRELQEAARSQALAAQTEGSAQVGKFRGGARSYVDLVRANGGLGQNGELRWSPELNAATQFMLAAQNKPYNTMNSEQLVDERIKLQKVINDLVATKQTNGVYKQYLDLLNSQLQTLQEIAAARAKITTAETQFSIAKTASSPQEQQRFRTFTEVQSNVQQGLEANKAKTGSGDATLRNTMALARKEVAKMEAELKGMDKSSAEARVLMDDIARIRGEMAKVQRASDEATRDLLKNLKAGPGGDLSGSEVATLIRAEFAGANVYSYQKRPLSEQRRLYDLYKAGKGPLAARPGTSHHGSGHALDMTPIPGFSLDRVVDFLESRGVEVIEALNERDPKTGSFHWHLAWKPKKSRYQTTEDNELQQLLEQRANTQQSKLAKRIQAIISEAKGGLKSVPELTAEAKTTADEYVKAGLHAFDVANPTEGLSPTRMQARMEARNALKEKLLEDVRKYFADFFRAVSDFSIDQMELALKDSGRILDEEIRKAKKIATDAQRQLDILGNRTNRNNYGAGTEYVLNRRKEVAQDASDQAQILATRQAIFRDTIAVSAAEAAVNAGPEGDAKKEQLEKIAAAWAKIREQLAAVAELQDVVNARHEKLAAIPLKERLEGAAQAWLENSGAMDSWQKQAENAVGPALDTLASGFSQFFEDIMTGSKSFKQALGDMLKTFAMFVVQMIAKALALMAVKAILEALGLKMPAGMQEGGPAISTGTTGGARFNGGPAIPGRVGGGSIYDYLRESGGGVRTGVSNRDSSLYNLAHGEYVVRSKSVREIGLTNMEMINKHGARGLAALRGANVMQNITLPKQETNVFVVKPESAPPMGPNDVLVTIQEDILQGGATKKLIKQVAQGA
jgi:TP901 family phage tail tape measure protein